MMKKASHLQASPRTPEFVLEEMLEEITPETLHPEIDFGFLVGKETSSSAIT